MLKIISIRRSIVLFMFSSAVLLASNIQLELQKQIDQIVLVDESNSSIDSNKTILGCDDKADPVEKQNCYKESATAILTKLSSSEESTKADDIKDIKEQLSAILIQLAKLEKQQSEIIKNRDKNLKKNDKVKLDSSKSEKQEKKEEAKEIKILEKTEDYTKIEVQKGENLSLYAKKFYDDNKKYRLIYNANRDKISKSFQISVGDILKIPTLSFLEKIKKKKIEDAKIVTIKENEPIKEEIEDNERVEVIEKVEIEKVEVVQKIEPLKEKLEDKKVVVIEDAQPEKKEEIVIEKLKEEEKIELKEDIKLEKLEPKEVIIENIENRNDDTVEMLDEVVIE